MKARRLLVPALLTLWASAAKASPAPRPRLDGRSPDDEIADTGAPDSGLQRCPHNRLEDAVELPEIPELYLRMSPGRAFGTPELVNLLVDSAAELAWLKPDADRIVIGDISAQKGGPVSGHRSHQGGIDADVALFFHDGRQDPYGFMNPVPGAFDVETNWLLIRSMVQTGLMERILIDQRYVDLLKRHAVKIGDLSPEEAQALFPTDPRERWKGGKIHHAPNHRDHLHVRVRCER